MIKLITPHNLVSHHETFRLRYMEQAVDVFSLTDFTLGNCKLVLLPYAKCEVPKDGSAKYRNKVLFKYCVALSQVFVYE